MAEDNCIYSLRKDIRAFHIDGCATIMTEYLAVQTIVRILRIHFDTCSQEALTVSIEIQTVCLTTVVVIVIGCIIADSQAGAQSLQNCVLGGCHMLIILHIDNACNIGIILVVVGPTGKNHNTAIGIKCLDSFQFISGVDLQRICSLCFTGSAGRSRHNQSLKLGIRASGDQIFAGVQRNGSDTIFGSKSTKVAHAVLVITVDILVVMRCVDTDVDKLRAIENIHFHIHREGILFTVEYHNDSCGNLGQLSGGGSPLEVHCQSTGGGNRITGGVNANNFAAVGGVSNGADGCRRGLTVKQCSSQCDFLVGNGSGSAANEAGDAKLQALANPNRCGNSQVTIALSHTDVVVTVGRIQGNSQITGCKFCRIIPGICNLTGVDDQFDLTDGVCNIGIVNLDIKGKLIGNFCNAGTQKHAVDGIVNLQVLIFGCVNTQVPNSFIQTFFSEVIGQNNIAGIVGIAPLALVVILVVGGSHVPTLIQGHGVVLITGIVTAGTDLAFTVTNFHQEHTRVNNSIPVCKVSEGTKGGTGMVELADRACAIQLAEQCVVCLHTGIVSLVVQNGIVTGNDTLSVEGIDMAGATGPGHFKAADSNDIRLAVIEVSDGGLVSSPQILAVRSSQRHIIQSILGVSGTGLIKVVGVIGKCHEVDICTVRQVLDVIQSRFQRARTVRVGGMGVQLTEVQLELSLTHNKAPGLGNSFAVCAGNGYGNCYLAVFHIFGGSIGQLPVFINSIDLFTIDKHFNYGIFTCVGDLSRDFRLLVITGFSIGCRGQVGDCRLVNNLHGKAGLEVEAHIIGTTDFNDQFLALDHACGNGHNVLIAASFVCQLFTVDQDLEFLYTKGSNKAESKAIILIDDTFSLRTDFGHGIVCNTVVDPIGSIGNRIELEGVNVIISDIVHAVGFESVSIVLQILAVLAVKLSSTAFHGISITLNCQSPVGILGSILGVECIVAGTVGAQVTKFFIVEAVVVTVLLNGED